MELVNRLSSSLKMERQRDVFDERAGASVNILTVVLDVNIMISWIGGLIVDYSKGVD